MRTSYLRRRLTIIPTPTTTIIHIIPFTIIKVLITIILIVLFLVVIRLIFLIRTGFVTVFRAFAFIFLVVSARIISIGQLALFAFELFGLDLGLGIKIRCPKLFREERFVEAEFRGVETGRRG